MTNVMCLVDCRGVRMAAKRSYVINFNRKTE
jgi:hypothetical protein